MVKLITINKSKMTMLQDTENDDCLTTEDAGTSAVAVL
jgi:hypothetical protein